MKQYKCSCPQHSIRERVPSWSPYQPLSKPLAHAPYRFCEMPISTDLHSLHLRVPRAPPGAAVTEVGITRRGGLAKGHRHDRCALQLAADHGELHRSVAL